MVETKKSHDFPLSIAPWSCSGDFLSPGSWIACETAKAADRLPCDGNVAMDQYLWIPFLVGWTSINPSYFDVNYRGTRFWPTAMLRWPCLLTLWPRIFWAAPLAMPIGLGITDSNMQSSTPIRIGMAPKDWSIKIRWLNFDISNTQGDQALVGPPILRCWALPTGGTGFQAAWKYIGLEAALGVCRTCRMIKCDMIQYK